MDFDFAERVRGCLRLGQWYAFGFEFPFEFVLIITTVVAGLLTDHSPSKSFPFLLGMITMIASSLMFFLGEHIAVVIAARALQGLSASFVWVSGLALLNSRVKASFVGTAMGYISVGTAAGEILGPIVGGTMYEHAGHFAVLGLVCGILGLDIVFRLLLVDDPSTKQHEDIENEEEPLLNGSTQPRGHSTQSRVAPHDNIKLNHISVFGYQFDKDLCATYYATCIIGTIRYAFESALVVFVTSHFSWSTSAGGGVLFAFLSPAALGPLIGYLTTTYGPRIITVLFFAIAALSLGALGLLTQSVPVIKILFVITVTVTGICVAALSTVQSIAFSIAMKKREILAKREGKKDNTGVGFGGFSMAWTFGMFAGPLAAELFVDRVTWLAFCVFLAALCAVSAVLMMFSWEQWEVPDDE
jgi:MFS family permease